MPTQHRLEITLAFLVGDRVTWAGRAGTYTIVWRRWHQGEVGTHILYGLRKVGEDQWPGAQIYTALEPDLRGA